MSAFFNIIGIPSMFNSSIINGFKSIETDDGDEVSLFKCSNESTIAFADTILNDSEGIAQALSEEFSAPVILFFLAEEVVWGYNLYRGGEEIDRYSSRPNYWKELSPRDYERHAGSASVIAKVWPNVEAEGIVRYLTDKDKVSEKQDIEKAYPDDEHEIWDGWQLTDFMRKLGLVYPFDGAGEFTVEHIISTSIGTKKGLAYKVEEEARCDLASKIFEYCQTNKKNPAQVWSYYQEHGSLPIVNQESPRID